MEHTIGTIAVVTLCTIVLRFLPFWVFGGKGKMPAMIQYLGKVLPSSIMVILVIYCLKDVSIFEGSRGLPEALAILVVAALHVWRKNTLLSIGVGTVFYMFLVQAVF